MNLATLRSQARLKSSVTSNDYSNANLDEQLNVAYYMIAEIMAQGGADYFEEQNVLFNLAQNSALYSLPTDCLQVKQFRFAFSTPSEASDYRVAKHYDPSSVKDVAVDEENISTSYPIVDVTGAYFRVKPTPTSAVTNGGKIWYIARPSALTNTGDTPVFPTQYHDLVAVYGAKEMAFKYKKWDKYDRLRSEWENGLQLLLNTLSDRDLGDNLRFKSPQETGVPVSNRQELPS